MTSTTVAIVIIEFIVISIACFLLIRFYKSNLVTFDVVFTVYLSWIMGFTGILLLPYDIANAFIYGKESNNPLVEVWRFIYWSTFFLAWFLLPIQMEYHNSGQFSFSGKIRDAIYRNIIYGIIAAIIGFIYFIYMLSASNGSPSQVIGFCMAMSNTYGVLLIIVLMGNGLVGLPKRLWEMSDYQGELIRLYMSAGSIENAFQEARYELEDCELEVKKAEHIIEIAVMGGTFDRDLLNYISILNNRVALFEFSNRANTRKYIPNNDTLEDREKFTERKSFIDLNSRLIRAQFQVCAYEIKWKNLLLSVQRYENLLANGNIAEDTKWCEMPLSTINSNSRNGISSNNSNTNSNINSNTTILPKITNMANRLSHGLLNQFTQFRLYLHNIYTYRLHRGFCRGMAVVCCGASLIILWSEMMLTTGWESPIGLMMTHDNIKSHSNNSAFIQIVALASLTYMSICTYWSLFRINLGSAYTLQGPNQSTHSSLIFNGEYLSRLQFTLGYNFLLILNVNKTQNTAFVDLMSNIQLIPVFGSSFLDYVPLIMIIVSILTLFDACTKIFRFFGMDTEESTSSNIFSCKKIELNDEDKELYDSGRAIVTSELRKMNQNNDNGGNYSDSHEKLNRSPKSSGFNNKNSNNRESRFHERKNPHELEIGRIPKKLMFSDNSDILSDSKKNLLFAPSSSSSKKQAMNNLKYSKQVSIDDDSIHDKNHNHGQDMDDNDDDDDDMETFTFHTISSDSPSPKESKDSSLFSNWKVFGGISKGAELLPSYIPSSSSNTRNSNSSDTRSQPFQPTRYSSSLFSNYSNGSNHTNSSGISSSSNSSGRSNMIDNPVNHNTTTNNNSNSTNDNYKSISKSSINFCVDDDDDDNMGGRYSGI